MIQSIITCEIFGDTYEWGKALFAVPRVGDEVDITKNIESIFKNTPSGLENFSFITMIVTGVIWDFDNEDVNIRGVLHRTS